VNPALNGLRVKLTETVRSNWGDHTTKKSKVKPGEGQINNTEGKNREQAGGGKSIGGGGG